MIYTNKFIETIRRNVKNGNIIKNFPCGNWDILNREQRMFLLECADYMEMLEKELVVRVKALELTCKNCNRNPNYLGVFSPEDFIDKARKELESKNG